MLERHAFFSVHYTSRISRSLPNFTDGIDEFSTSFKCVKDLSRT